MEAPHAVGAALTQRCPGRPEEHLHYIRARRARTATVLTFSGSLGVFSCRDLWFVFFFPVLETMETERGSFSPQNRKSNVAGRAERHVGDPDG